MQKPPIHEAEIKLRDVQLEINKFKSVRQVAEREVNELVSSIEGLNKRKKELDEIVSIPYADLAQFVKLASRVVSEATLSMNQALSISEGFNSLIGKLGERIEEQEKELDAVIKKKNDALKVISEENVRLGVVKADLDIYAKRLQRKIDAYGLSDEIKVII